MKKKIVKENESKFQKKAHMLLQRVTRYYDKPKEPSHPYSFSANRYRISLFLGIILILYGLYKIDLKQSSNDCNIVNKISDSISNGTHSLGVLYTIYKDGGLKTASSLKNTQARNLQQMFYIDFSKVSQSFGEKSVLICGQRARAVITSLNKKKNSLEERNLDFIVGSDIINNNAVSNAFLQLSKNDDVTIAFDTKENDEDVTGVLYVSKIDIDKDYLLGFYESSVKKFGESDVYLKCDSYVNVAFKIYNLSSGSVISDVVGKNISIGGSNVPIIIDRVLVGKNAEDSIQVFTKLKNLCVFRSEVGIDVCGNFWSIGDVNRMFEDVVMLEITGLLKKK